MNIIWVFSCSSFTVFALHYLREICISGDYSELCGVPLTNYKYRDPREESGVTYADMQSGVFLSFEDDTTINAKVRRNATAVHVAAPRKCMTWWRGEQGTTLQVPGEFQVEEQFC